MWFVIGLSLGYFLALLFRKPPTQKDLDEIAVQRESLNINWEKLHKEKENLRAVLKREMTKEQSEIDRATERLEKEREKLEEKRSKEVERIEKEKREFREHYVQQEKKLAELQKLAFEKTSYHSALEEVTNLWINDSFEDIIDRMTATNYATLRTRMDKIFEKCEKLGLDIEKKDIKRFEEKLKEEHKLAIENQKAKEEQARIKELIKEEQRAEKLRAEEIKRIEKEQKEMALKKAEIEERMKLLRELEELKQITSEQLKELQNISEENEVLAAELVSKERAKSMAEMTKAGHVYVISNVGSFGEKIFKIGMTRRLIPEDRIKELGDASVPFPFDVHMMISSEDAPALESKLHEELWHFRMNWVNNHKEFFSVTFEQIKEVVEKNCSSGTYQLVEYAQASQWRESLKLKELGEDIDYDKSVESDDEEAA